MHILIQFYSTPFNIQLQMQAVYKHPSSGPAGTDEISIELYSKHKLTQDVKAELSHHLTQKLPKPKGNKMLLIGAKIGILPRLMEAYCDHIDIIAEPEYVPILEAVFVKGQSVEYTFNREGFIGEKHVIPAVEKSKCTMSVIQISKFHEHIKRESFYDIILLQNVIVHPQINILKQLMRLRHNVLITMIVPGKLVHQNLFELLSGIEQNILHVFYNQATHERVEYIRYITGRRQEINIWEIFVWIKKDVPDVKVELGKVSAILEDQIKKNFVKAEVAPSIKGTAAYETDVLLNQYMDFHYGESEYFGIRNFPLNCAQKCIDTAKTEHIKGRALDIGCAVGRSTLELAHYFDEVVGLEYSQVFVDAANKILTENHKQLIGKVKFIQGDACKLDANLGKFNLIFAGNLIDRLYDPEAFLHQVVKHLADKAILVITSPYTWLEEYTKVDHWLGGRNVNGKDISTYERLREILTSAGVKELKNSQDVRFTIKQNPWVYQYTSAHMTFWMKQ